MSQSFDGQQDSKQTTRQQREAGQSTGGLPAQDMTALLLHLQRTAGNRAVNGLLQHWAANAPVQARRKEEAPEVGLDIVPMKAAPADNVHEPRAARVKSTAPDVGAQAPSLADAGTHLAGCQRVTDRATVVQHDHAQAHGSGASRSVQRKQAVYPTPFIGGALTHNKSTVTFDPIGSFFPEGGAASSSLFPDLNTGDVSIKAGAKGTARIYMHMYVFEENGALFSNTTWEQIYFVEWNVSAPDGKLTIDGNGAKTINSKTGDPYNMGTLDSVDATAGADYVRMTPTIKSGGSSESVAPAGIGGTLNSPGNSLTIPFTLRIHVTDLPGIPDPHGVVAIGTVQALRTHEVLFEKRDQDKISSKQFDQLMSWYKDILSQTTRDSVQAGSEPIILIGHASTTGGSKHNLDLSDRRMKEVLDDLTKFAGNKAKFEYRAAGALEAQTDPNVESQAERKVTVQVNDTFFDGEAGFVGPRVP